MGKAKLRELLEREKLLYKQSSEGKFDAIKEWRQLMNEHGHDIIRAQAQRVKLLEKQAVEVMCRWAGCR